MSVLVITTVPVEEGSVDELAELFDDTNRDLVKAHEQWLGATFTADRSTNTVTVIARWRSAEGYEALRGSDEYAKTMSRFAPRFTGLPSITINEVLVEM